MFSYPLKQLTIDYFQLNLIHKDVSNPQFSKFLSEVLHSSPYPIQKAIDIWDTFVMTNTDFFDIPASWATKEKLEKGRNDIRKSQNVHEIVIIFGSMGVSSFCNRS